MGTPDNEYSTTDRVRLRAPALACISPILNIRVPAQGKNVQLPAKCRGVALITAVLIIALITVAATSMASRQLLDSRRTGNILHSDQAYVYALAGEQAVARAMLDFDIDKNVDHAGEEWFETLSLGVPMSMPNGTVIVSIRDATASFPINSVVAGSTTSTGTGGSNSNNNTTGSNSGSNSNNSNNNAINKPNNSFRMLRSMLASLLTDPPAPEIPAAIRDWIDSNEDVSAGGAEDLDYLSLDPPYRAGNTPFTSLSELRLVAGMKPEHYAKLLSGAGGVPLFNTLPSDTPININSASKEVILNLHDRIDDTIASDIMTERAEALKNKKAPYTDAGKFFADIKKKVFPVTPTDPQERQEWTKFVELDALTSVTSNYFEVTTVAQIGNTEVMLHSLLKRDGKTVTTLRRGIGVH